RILFFFSSRRRHTRSKRDWSSDVCSSDLLQVEYILKIDYMSQVWLEWKTGVGHRYVEQNTREFLDHVLDGEAHTFTKKFTYSPVEHYFLEQDLELFKFLDSFITSVGALKYNVC